MLTNPEVKILPFMRGRTEITCALVLESRLVRIAKIGRATNQPRHILGQNIKDLPSAFPSGDALGIRRKCGQILVPAIRQLTPLHPIDLIREFRILPGVVGK